VWGCVRPATFAAADTGQPQSAEIQFAPGSSGSFTTLRSVQVGQAGNCYFDVRLTFRGTGTVRVAWQYPALDPSLGDFSATQNRTVYSRAVGVTVK
jgi:hypothetical protein